MSNTKTPRSTLITALLALLLGGGAALLRIWQKAAGYDTAGLPIPMGLPSLILVGFLIACTVLYLVLALRQPKKQPEDKVTTANSTAAVLLMVSAGVLFLAAMLTALELFQGYTQATALAFTAAQRSEALRTWLTSALPSLIFSILALPTVIALFYRAKLAKTGAGTPGGFAALMPPVCCWLWLIEAYRLHTANPIVWDYAFLLFAIITLLVSAYFRAGFAYGVGKPRAALFTTLLALTFTVAALTDCDGLHALLILIAFLIYTLAELPVFGPYTDPPAQPDESHSETQEETTHE